MNKLAELKKKLADLKGKGLNIIEAAEQDGRDMTAEEQDQYDVISADIDTVKGEIETVERLANARRSMEALPSPAGRTQVNDLDPATTHGFKGVDEFAHVVRDATLNPAGADRRLMGAPTDTHQGGQASGEGYEVPPDMRDSIFEVVEAQDEFAGLVDEEPTSKREVKSLADETTPWSATGVQANWRAEGNQMTPTKLATDARSVPLHELYAFVLATDELMEDAPRLASRITRRAGEAIAWKRNSSMIYGTGAGQPLGWMNSAAMLTLAKEGGQAADTILAKNVLKMYSRLLVLPGDRPFWLINRDCVPELMTMMIGDKPMWVPPSGLADAPGGMLLGYPVRFSEHAKSLGDKGDIQLISPKGYYALRRESGPKFAQSMHLYFDFAIEAFRWTFRFGGQPHLSKPVEPAHGSASKSHFLTLAERA